MCCPVCSQLRFDKSWSKDEQVPQASAAWLSLKMVLAGATERRTIRDECIEGCSIERGAFHLTLDMHCITSQAATSSKCGGQEMYNMLDLSWWWWWCT